MNFCIDCTHSRGTTSRAEFAVPWCAYDRILDTATGTLHYAHTRCRERNPAGACRDFVNAGRRSLWFKLFDRFYARYRLE